MRFTKEHEWIELEGDIGTVGITDFAQSSLGDVIFVDVNTLNKKVNGNDVFGTIDAVKVASDLFLPISGQIIEINPLLEKQPELVNSDPYGDGWIVKVKVDNPDEMDTLLTEEEYKNFIN